MESGRAVPQLMNFLEGLWGLTRVQKKFAASMTRAMKLSQDLGFGGLIGSVSKSEPKQKVHFRMYRHSQATGHSPDGTDSDGSDDSVERVGGRATVETGSARRKRLLGGKLVPQLSNSGFGGV